MTQSRRLLLASTSPRRRELLALLQVPFESLAPPFEETVRDGLPAIEQARAFAEGKARSVAAQHPDAWVIGSDTLIERDAQVLGKPDTMDDARTMLQSLRGRPHRIHTAVTLCCATQGWETSQVSTVDVWMRAWTEAELDAYLATGESLGKAGAYAIQGGGAALIERIEGDYTAAVGLPLQATGALLRAGGWALPVEVETLYRERPYANWARFGGAQQQPARPSKAAMEADLSASVTLKRSA